MTTAPCPALPPPPSTPPMLDLLYPLSQFFHRGDPLPLAELENGGEQMPEPYRSLLVHDSDMTSTLERHHGERLALRPLDWLRRGDDLLRQVVLVGKKSGRPRELGAIRIDLATFADEPRRLILEGERPLGAILGDFEIPYSSAPRLFFHVESDPRMAKHFDLDRPHRLYGRQNVLASPAGRPLAEVVEILPPAVATPNQDPEDPR